MHKITGIRVVLLMGVFTAHAVDITLNYKGTIDGGASDRYTTNITVGATSLTAVFLSDNGTASITKGGHNGLAIAGGKDAAWIEAGEAYDLTVTLFADFGTARQADVTSSYTIKLRSANVRHANTVGNYEIRATDRVNGMVTGVLAGSGKVGVSVDSLDYTDLTVTGTLRVEGVQNAHGRPMQIESLEFEVIDEPETLGLITS